jgi:hypothetical protein
MRTVRLLSSRRRRRRRARRKRPPSLGDLQALRTAAYSSWPAAVASQLPHLDLRQQRRAAAARVVAAAAVAATAVVALLTETLFVAAAAAAAALAKIAAVGCGGRSKPFRLDITFDGSKKIPGWLATSGHASPITSLTTFHGTNGSPSLNQPARAGRLVVAILDPLGRGG